MHRTCHNCHPPLLPQIQMHKLLLMGFNSKDLSALARIDNAFAVIEAMLPTLQEGVREVIDWHSTPAHEAIELAT